MEKKSFEDIGIIEHVTKIRNRIVTDICKPLKLDNDDLDKIKMLLFKEIKKGLCKRTHDSAKVKCFPTYIQELPKGCERGKFLTVEVGGLPFRIVLIHLRGKEEVKMDIEEYALPNDLMTGTGTDLFDHIANQLVKFIFKYQLEYEEINIGFMFAFPLRQIGLSKGILIRWSKGFNCTGVVGRDVVSIFREAIERKARFHIGLIVVLNDTTGTLISSAWKDKSTKIGLIIDMGTNACYLEKTKHVELFKSDVKSPATMIINTEWGAFGDNGILDYIRNKYDKLVDKNSLNPGAQIFEKMVSGMYMGEIVRLIMLDCIEAGALFDGIISEQMKTRYSFLTDYVVNISNDDSGSYVVIKYVFTTMGYKRISRNDSDNIRYICDHVSNRAANLMAAALACLVDRIGDPYITIALDGYICRGHPHFLERLKIKAKELVQPEHKFNIEITEDGAARGAAILAATSSFKKLKR